MPLRVGIFGGSFNPPHIGHVAICEWLLKGGGLVDLVYVVPCFIHPFNKDIAPFEHRYKMCLFAFKKLGPKVIISKIEKDLGEVSLTIRTIKVFKQRYPEHRFSLITGEDIKKQTNAWHQFEEIKSLVPIILVPRGATSPIPDVSSTSVREHLAAGKPIIGMVPREVAVYIVTNGLYRNS